MTDYSSWKVTDLKAELKRRGIPQTGLRLKQQIVERLQEADSAEQPAPADDAIQSEPETEQKQEQQETRSPEPESRVEDSESQERSKPEAPIDESTAEADVAPPAAGPTNGSQSRDAVPAADGAAGPVSTETVVESVPEKSPTPNEPLEKPSSPKTTDQSLEPAEQDTATSQHPAEVAPAKEAQAEPTEQDVPTQPPIPEPTPAEGESVPAPELSREESIDDSKKRKRRSQSPPPSPRTMALKRAKLENGGPKDMVGEEAPEGEISQVPERPVSSPKESVAPPQDTDVEMTTEEQVRESLVEHTGGHIERPPSPQPQDEKDEDKTVKPVEQEVQGTERTDEADESHPTRRVAGDARFKGLFPTNGEQLRHDHAPHVEDDERMVEAALHPATTSLYIRDFMRPLQPAAVKMHLASLAAPPGSSPNTDTILTFFLDSIKTHCFVTFSNVAAASRVRTALHGTIWPEERSRKPLWVDFVPEEKVQDWIDTEQASGNGSRGGPRWEIAYEDTDDGITAVLREAAPPHLQSRGPPPPAGPRADRDIGRGGPPRELPAHGFQALDDRFMSTAAKPKLYYLPVSKEVANKRLDRFDDLAHAGPVDKRGGDEMRKYTFEDTDFFVDKGPEYGRRGRGGGRGGRSRYHDDFGGSWRGRW